MNSSNLRSLAGLSVDVDSAASHLRGYGISDSTDLASVYEKALPRMLECFSELGVQASFFLIAEEAAKNKAAVSAISASGHETASHSMTHTLPFDLRDSAKCKLEVSDSKKLLEDITSCQVQGFRAPSWDTSPALLEALQEAGYCYDASSFPSWMKLLLRWQVQRLGQENSEPLKSSPLECFIANSAPHKLSLKKGELVEIPLTTAPFLRIPYYHTLRLLLPKALFGPFQLLVEQRRTAICYVFHAVDFLGLKEDGLDERLGRHPGMQLPLQKKLSLAKRALRELSRKRQVVPLAKIASVL